ncbi:hypothetical protein V6N12_048593 [Hibiscus sabdariffa]|uniref:Uncharacterized protein n=1 Tax=Hibiscus sabdariffa TaxID=183260 RepID=A0ABR2EK26_9ROSI
MKGRRLTDLDLLPGGSSHRERPCMPEFRAPLHPLVMQGFTTLFQQQGSSSRTAFRPIAAAACSSSLVPIATPNRCCRAEFGC